MLIFGSYPFDAPVYPPGRPAVTMRGPFESVARMSKPQTQATNYDLLEQQLVSLFETEKHFIANAANFAALVFNELPDINWAGFYFPEEDGLVLGPFGGKPACTRLAAGRGACGAAFTSRKTVVVADVTAFEDHIVCDTHSRAEIVIPLLSDGRCCGVFDVDSPIQGRFTDNDRSGLERLVARFTESTDIPERYSGRT